MKTYRCHICQNEWAEIRITLARCPYCGSKDFTLVKVVTEQGRTGRTLTTWADDRESQLPDPTLPQLTPPA